MNAIGYIRVSTTDQAKEGISLEIQREKIQQYAKLHDMNLIGVLADEGISGKSIKDRPGILEVLRMVESAEVDSVIIYKLDRLARNVKEALDIADLLNQKQVALHSIIDHIDTKSANGRLFYTMLAAMAAWERDIISERTQDAMTKKKQKGELISRDVPYGYREFTVIQGEKSVRLIVPDENEQEMISRIYRLRQGAHTIQSIVEIIETEGYKARRGKRISFETVRRILMQDRSKDQSRNPTRSTRKYEAVCL